MRSIKKLKNGVMDMWQSRKVSEVREGRRCVRKGKEG
jgi:hypothetical protein